MKKDIQFYWKLFFSTFTLSAFTFGGGYVIVPLMRKKFVETYQWIDEEEMMDLIAIAQSSPGPIAVNSSIIIGYRLSGIFGAMLTVLGTILPPLIILSVISLFYAAFRDSAAVSAVMRGMQAGVAAVIADAVIGMGVKVVRERRILADVIMVLAFIAAYFFNVNVALVILACGVVGAVSTLYRQRKKRGEGKSE